MKMRNKGKVYPNPSSSSSTPTPYPAPFPAGDSLAVLNLLPAAILTLAVALSLEDREVLSYMITRSIKSTNPRSSFSSNNNKKKTLNTQHESPFFDCDCFDCYTYYWSKWNTSINRELIHQVIEAFEENLTSSEQNNNNKKGKRREKTTHRRFAGKVLSPPDLNNIQLSPAYDVALVEAKGEEEGADERDEVLNAAVEPPPALAPETTVVVRGATARKVLPDVIGLFNWRLWGIWSPNV